MAVDSSNSSVPRPRAAEHARGTEFPKENIHPATAQAEAQALLSREGDGVWEYPRLHQRGSRSAVNTNKIAEAEENENAEKQPTLSCTFPYCDAFYN